MSFCQAAVQTITGIPGQAPQGLIQLLSAQPKVQAVWLFGSRAMGRYHQGSDFDPCLEAPILSNSDRLRIMAAVDHQPLPWQGNLGLNQELPADIEAHVRRVGRYSWRKL